MGVLLEVSKGVNPKLVPANLSDTPAYGLYAPIPCSIPPNGT
jgi:hypothetical protein